MHWLQVTITPIAALVLSGALYLYGRHRGRVSERRLVEQFICDLYTWPERPTARVLQREGAKRRARIRFQASPHGYGTLTPAPPDDESESEKALRHFLADLGISAEDLVAVIELERDSRER